ncbi:hypothetical protein LX64_01618 [Chitinophaga skermanii]|uniref:Uncharacterized protein n=1 Tax=Chitinophaga skermanii TaxID=331697 RepID=A0A327QQG4_9BACT|nr:hypothetical protein [Chitinophaga skermanii]RAJ06491.1 hypothetical protein LX64_01618 [Chitinophaga skermanii]
MSKALYLHPKHLQKVSFYPTANGYLTTTKQRKATNWEHACYDKIRAHRKEFGRAAQTAAQVRLAFKQIIELIPDKTMYRRFSSQLLSIIKNDHTNIRGERTVEAGDVTALTRFEFNNDAYFHRIFKAKYAVAFDRTTGRAQVQIPAFKPSSEVRIPKNATHFKLVAVAQAINFETCDAQSKYTSTTAFPLDSTLKDDITLELQLPAHDPRHVFISIGIEFVEHLHGREYAVRGGHENAMSIAGVYTKVAHTTVVQTGKCIPAIVAIRQQAKQQVDVVTPVPPKVTPKPTMATQPVRRNKIPSFIHPPTNKSKRKQVTLQPAIVPIE